MKSAKTQKRVSKLVVNLALLFLVILWTIPTMGIFVSSFRERAGYRHHGLVAGLPTPGMEGGEDDQSQGIKPGSKHHHECGRRRGHLGPATTGN